MLGQVPSYKDEQLVKSIEIGDLSMRTNKKTIDNLNISRILKASNSTPESSFFTPWFLRDKGFFRICLTVVGPQTEQPESYFPLSRREAKRILETISNTVKTLQEDLR